MKRFIKRLIASAMLSLAIVGSTVGLSYGQDKVVRIGFQKYGKLVLLKSKGTLEGKLKGAGYQGGMDGVSFRAAAARGAQCRSHRFRQHRRSAADLRASRGRADPVCRL